MIEELERMGISMRAQAVTCDVSLGTIYYWKDGGEPKYRNGQLLLDLYMQRVGREPPLVLYTSTAHSSFTTTYPST